MQHPRKFTGAARGHEACRTTEVGRARGSGGCYHLSFRSGSRASGSCAGAAHDYITRSDEYDDPERDAAIYVESDHMPEWAEDEPRLYWDSADLYERANGRLYVSADSRCPAI